MKLKYIVDMKPEFILTNALDYFTGSLACIDRHFDVRDRLERFDNSCCYGQISLRCCKDVFQIMETPTYFNMLYMYETMDKQTVSQIKKVLKFHTIAKEMVKIYKDDGLLTILRETIYSIDYISYLYNTLRYGSLSGKKYAIHEALYESERRRHPKVHELILKPYIDYEPTSKFLATRDGTPNMIDSMCVLTNLDGIYNFMREMWDMPARYVFPLYELLNVNEKEAIELDEGLQILRTLLKRFVKRDVKTTLRISGSYAVYEYVIATGEERIIPLLRAERQICSCLLRAPLSSACDPLINSVFTGDVNQPPFNPDEQEKQNIKAMLEVFDFKVDVTDHSSHPSFQRDEYDLRPLFGAVDL